MGQTLHALNGIRGTAALVVVLYHFGTRLDDVMPSGHLAVDLFFLMSGVVLASAYDQPIARGLTATAFMQMRIVRLYPMYAIGLIAALATTLEILPPFSPLFSALMLPTPPARISAPLYPGMGIAWSLLCELLANLVFVVLHKRLQMPLLIGIIWVSGVTLITCGLIFGTLEAGMNWDTAWLGVLRVMFSFFLGVAIWRARARLRWSLPPAAILALVMAICAVAPGPAYDVLIVACCWPILVICGMNARSSAPYLGWLGDISYPVYCLHGALISSALDLRSPASAVAALVALVAVSWVAARFYDAPVRAWLSKPRRAVA